MKWPSMLMQNAVKPTCIRSSICETYKSVLYASVMRYPVVSLQTIVCSFCIPGVRRNITSTECASRQHCTFCPIYVLLGLFTKFEVCYSSN